MHVSVRYIMDKYMYKVSISKGIQIMYTELTSSSIRDDLLTVSGLRVEGTFP